MQLSEEEGASPKDCRPQTAPVGKVVAYGAASHSDSSWDGGLGGCTK